MSGDMFSASKKETKSVDFKRVNIEPYLRENKCIYYDTCNVHLATSKTDDLCMRCAKNMKHDIPAIIETLLKENN